MTITRSRRGRWRAIDLAICGAVVASIALALFGVWAVLEAPLMRLQPLAIAAFGILATLVGVCEIAASQVLVFAARRQREGAWLRCVFGVGVFAAATAMNLLAGHYGAQAMNRALIAPQRAPLEARIATAHAVIAEAGPALAALDERAAREKAEMQARHDAEAARNPRFVTANATQARTDREALSARHDAERTSIEARKRAAEAEQKAAKADLQAAPKLLSEPQLWGMAAIFELLKGVLALVAAPAGRKRKKQSTRPSEAAIQAAEQAGKVQRLRVADLPQFKSA